MDAIFPADGADKTEAYGRRGLPACHSEPCEESLIQINAWEIPRTARNDKGEAKHPRLSATSAGKSRVHPWFKTPIRLGGPRRENRDAKQWRVAILLHRFGWHYGPVCFLITFSPVKNHVSPLPRRQS
jgi:hypothetical protein